jgi:trk system potassium uptake protein TrkA
MADNRRFVVLGLGTFGRALARRLHENGCRVTGVDANRERVEDLKEELYEAVIADACDRETLEQLSLANATAVFICLGEEISRSLLAALHCKELGARQLIARGVTVEHGKILTKLGVNRVVFAETEIAREVADRAAWPNVLDFLPIDPEYSFIELAIPDSFVGMTLQDLNLRRRFGVWVVGVKDALTGKLEMFPDGAFRLGDDQMLLAVGKHEELARLREAK